MSNKKPRAAAPPPTASAAGTAPASLEDLTRGRVIEQIPLDELLPYARNSRTHSAEQINQIAASIREFGWTQPCLVRGSPPTMLAGHARAMAGRKLGMTHAPCIRLDDLTDAQARA